MIFKCSHLDVYIKTCLLFRNPPDIDDIELPESTLRFFFKQINRLLSDFYYISSGNDLITFFLVCKNLFLQSSILNHFLRSSATCYITFYHKHYNYFQTIACLWTLSAFGSLCSTLTLLYIGNNLRALFHLFLIP